MKLISLIKNYFVTGMVIGSLQNSPYHIADSNILYPGAEIEIYNSTNPLEFESPNIPIESQFGLSESQFDMPPTGWDSLEPENLRHVEYNYDLNHEIANELEVNYSNSENKKYGQQFRFLGMFFDPDIWGVSIILGCFEHFEHLLNWLQNKLSCLWNSIYNSKIFAITSFIVIYFFVRYGLFEPVCWVIQVFEPVCWVIQVMAYPAKYIIASCLPNFKSYWKIWVLIVVALIGFQLY